MIDQQNSRLYATPEAALDRIFEGYDDALPQHVDILVADEEHVKLDTHQRAAKRLRVRGHAAAYLMNRPIRLQSTCLQGPLDGWKNPWIGKPPATARRSRRKADEGLVRDHVGLRTPKKATKRETGGSRLASTLRTPKTSGAFSRAEGPLDAEDQPFRSSPDNQLLGEARILRAQEAVDSRLSRAKISTMPQALSPQSNEERGMQVPTTSPAADDVGLGQLGPERCLSSPIPDQHPPISNSRPSHEASDLNAAKTNGFIAGAASPIGVLQEDRPDQENTMSRSTLPQDLRTQKEDSTRSPRLLYIDAPRLQPRRRLSFNNTPVAHSHLRQVRKVPSAPVFPLVETAAEHHDDTPNPHEGLSTQAALVQAQASFKNIMTPSQAALHSPPCQESMFGSPQTSPLGLPVITPFRVFTTSRENKENDFISTQALFDDARNLTFSTVKKPAPVRPQTRISQAFRISKTGSQSGTSPKSSSGKPHSRPATQDSVVGNMDIDAALEDISQFLEVSDLPDTSVKKPARLCSPQIPANTMTSQG